MPYGCILRKSAPFGGVGCAIKAGLRQIVLGDGKGFDPPCNLDQAMFNSNPQETAKDLNGNSCSSSLIYPN